MTRTATPPGKPSFNKEARGRVTPSMDLTRLTGSISGPAVFLCLLSLFFAGCKKTEQVPHETPTIIYEHPVTMDIPVTGSWQGEQLNKAKEILAYELTKMVHGEAEADQAQAAAKAVFGGSGEGVPTVEIAAEDGNDILSLLVKSGLCASKSDARRNVQQGGVTANDSKVTDIAKTFTEAELRDGVVLKRGKKNFRKMLLK